jgi:acyl-CoA thioesterase
MSFPRLLASAQPREDGFSVVIPEDWHQGRTAYGGLTAALALVAARQVGGEYLPPLRSAQVAFVGPMYGEVELRARVLRAGRNVTWMSAEVLRDGDVGLTATFAFMGAVENKVQLKSTELPAGLVPVDEARVRETPPNGPRLLDQMDIRFAVPPSEHPKAEICWWVRLRDREGIDPALQLVLCADAPPPGVFPLLPRPAPPVSSMTWLLNLLSPAPQTRDGWWLMRVTGDYSEDGCSSDRTEIWNEAGEPVSLAMQSVAIFG